MLIDSHVHLDLTFSGQPGRIAWMKQNHYLPVSWAFGSNIVTTADLRAYLLFQQKTIRRIHGEGLVCYYLSGVHPRNIPWDLDVKVIPELLGPYLEDPLCRGIGEIGLETGTEREVEVLLAQLELADRVMEKGRGFGLHTPRGNKAAVTLHLLEVLKPCHRAKDRMVVDHCTPETIGEVLKAGYRAGITVSPAKSKASDVQAILSRYPEYEDRIMINTDSGGRFCEDLFALAESNVIEESKKQKILVQNAAVFYGISPSWQQGEREAPPWRGSLC
jgi:hypothetical protein